MNENLLESVRSFIISDQWGDGYFAKQEPNVVLNLWWYLTQ